MPQKYSSIVEILEEHALIRGEKLFCKDLSSGQSFSYKSFNGYVNKCANFIKEEYGDIDIVSSALKNSIEGLIVFFAVQKVGASINPMPNSLSYNEIKKNINHLSPQLVFLEKDAFHSDESYDSKVFFIDREEDAFLKYLDKYVPTFEAQIKKTDNAAFYYTSGTTSNPKCIQYSHGNQIHLIDSICRCFGYKEDSIHFGFLPIGHTAITNYQLLPALFLGSTLLLAENYMSIRKNFWQIVNQEKVTNIQTVPTVLEMILNSPTEFKDFKNLEVPYMGCGSATLSVEIQKRFNEKFLIPVVNLYGLSESGPSHFDDPHEKDWEPGSIGVPIDVNDCKIFKDDMIEAAVDEVGQIALKGKNIFQGYYKNHEATEAAFFGDYFLTGDLGYKDKSGKFFFADRKKDLIIKGGVNIFPGEIEEVIYELKSVALVAVIGIKDRIYGEEIVAYIQKVKGSSLTNEEVIDHCAKYLQRIKLPKDIKFLEEMPKTPSGKILKRNLK